MLAFDRLKDFADTSTAFFPAAIYCFIAGLIVFLISREAGELTRTIGSCLSAILASYIWALDRSGSVLLTMTILTVAFMGNSHRLIDLLNSLPYFFWRSRSENTAEPRMPIKNPQLTGVNIALISLAFLLFGHYFQTLL